MGYHLRRKKAGHSWAGKVAAAFAGYQVGRPLARMRSGASHGRVQGISVTALRLNCGVTNQRSWRHILSKKQVFPRGGIVLPLGKLDKSLGEGESCPRG